MNDREWYQLMKDRKEDIMELGKQAYAEALRNPNIKCRVELTEDGDVSTHIDMAGSDHRTREVFIGEAIVLFSFCFQEGPDIEIPDEEIMEKAEEKSVKLDAFLTLQEEEPSSSLEIIIRDNLEELEPDDEKRKLLNEVLDECMEEAIQCDIDNFAYDEVEKKLDECMESYDEPEPEKKQNAPNLYMSGKCR